MPEARRDVNPDRNRRVRGTVGRRARPLQEKVDGAEGRAEALEDQNTDQATKINELRQEVNDAKAVNTNQATKIGDMRAEINALQNANDSKTQAIQKLKDDVNVLLNFRDRAAGFAPAASNDTVDYKH